MEAGRRGVDAVPTLLKKMFSRVLWLAAVIAIKSHRRRHLRRHKAPA